MMKMDPELNVYGDPIEPCSFSPLTGFFRDGHCNTCKEDQGSHTCLLYTSDAADE